MKKLNIEKELKNNKRLNQEAFRAGEVSWNKTSSINISSKTLEKGPRRKIFRRFFA